MKPHTYSRYSRYCEKQEHIIHTHTHTHTHTHKEHAGRQTRNKSDIGTVSDSLIVISGVRFFPILFFRCPVRFLSSYFSLISDGVGGDGEGGVERDREERDRRQTVLTCTQVATYNVLNIYRIIVYEPHLNSKP